MAINEGIHDGEFLLSEGNNTISREKLTLAATGSDLVSGTLLGKVTATGHYKPYSDGASDGSQTVTAILYKGVKANAGTQPIVVIARLAEVAAAKLTGLDANGTADLAALNIIVRS